MTQDEEIQKLGEIWYWYVNADHHKDRDCHFYIEKKWSYGDSAMYMAHHAGYIADYFYSPERETYVEAAWDLISFMRQNVFEAVRFCKKFMSGKIGGVDDEDWDDFITKERAAKIIELYEEYLKNR